MSEPRGSLSRSIRSVVQIAPVPEPIRDLMKAWATHAAWLEVLADEAKTGRPPIEGFAPTLVVDNDRPDAVQPMHCAEEPIR